MSERARTQEALLVGVEDGDQRDLGQVEALAQEVDADEDVEVALAQAADDLDTLDGLDIGMEIAHADAEVVVVVGQILGHLLGQAGDENALVRRATRLRISLEEIVDLGAGLADFDFRIDEAGRANQLLDDEAAGLAAIRSRRA